MQTHDLFHPPLPTEAGKKYAWSNLAGASASLALSSVIRQSIHPILIIAPDSLSASRLVEELTFFSTNSQPLLHFPDWETLPYDHFSPHQDILSERLATLSRAATLQNGAIITTMSTLMHRLAPRDYLDKFSFLLKLGEKLNIEALRARMVNAGYRVVSQVREHGEFAVRGSIIDIYPMGSHAPYRIDLFDDEVESIQTFSPDTQRSIARIDEIHLLPAKEFPLSDDAIEFFRQQWRNQFSGNPLKSPIYQDVSEGIASPGIEYYFPLFFERTFSLFDYLPADTLIVTIGDPAAKTSEFWHEINTRFEQGRHDASRPLLPPETLFIGANELNDRLRAYSVLNINGTEQKTTLIFDTMPVPTHLEIESKSSHPLSHLQTWIQDYAGRVLFCVESSGRREVLLQLFRSISLAPTFHTSWQTFFASTDKYGIVVSAIEEGFSLNQPALTVLTENHLYGKRVMQRRLRKKSTQDPDAIIRDLTELQPNDPVVHIDHGVGRYTGLQTLSVGNQLAEFLCLEYQGGDKLYVPGWWLHVISR